MDVHALWLELETKTLSQVATHAGVSKQQMVALFDQAGLTGRQSADPGPDEILAATEAIRREWTPEQEKARWIAARRLTAL